MQGDGTDLEQVFCLRVCREGRDAGFCGGIDGEKEGEESKRVREGRREERAAWR